VKIFLATENAGKLREIRAIFEQKLPQAELLSIADLPPEIRKKYDAKETGLTYAENALIKARGLARLVGGTILADANMPSLAASAQTPPWVMADANMPSLAASAQTPPWVMADAKTASVPASAQTPPWVMAEDSGLEVEALGRAPGIYSARYAPTDRERCEKILNALRDLPAAQRRAQFVACVTVLENGRNPIYFFGRRTGTVATELRGDKGFGYDPIFIPDGETETWGEAPEKSKLLLSHRGIALKLAIDYLIVRLSQNSERAGHSSKVEEKLP
jgi:XTP/dITP diphosphohydrolase